MFTSTPFFIGVLVFAAPVIGLTLVEDDGELEQRILGSQKCPKISGLCTGEWVSFKIYGRSDTKFGRQILVANGTSNIKDVGFKENQPVAILIHGFADSSRSYLLVDMRKELLRNKDMSVIMMDWSKLVPDSCYLTSVYNVPYAGRCLSDLIMSMKMPSSGLHVIGFSLGAHVPGSAADFLAPYKIPRITGLDPALPLFWGYPSQRRLRKDDAVFVDVIHTNAFLEGHFLALGHVDFYVNGGIVQPGCGSGVVDKLACSHSRSAMYYNESINSEVGFWGCTGRFWNIELSCKSENIKWLMGYHVNTSLRGIVIVKTASSPPFALGKPGSMIAK